MACEISSIKSENRRLLFVAPSAYPLGGVATWLDYLLPGLEEQGWEPTLGLVAGVHHDPERYLVAHPFDRVVSIYNPTGSQEGRIRALCKTIAAVDPAIVLSVNIPNLFLAQARLRRKRQVRARTVMTLHGIQADLLDDARMFRGMLDAVICTNRLTCELVRDVAGVEGERIYYAPYGVEVGPEDPSRLRRQRGDEPLRIAWVGRLEQEQKRVHDLPAILEALDAKGLPFELWVVGAGPEEDRLRGGLARWLQDGRARLFGELPRERVCAEIYPQADCFLLTSSWETGPIVVWEAMSSGLPILTSRYLGSGPEGSLKDGENCLMFPVGDAAAAAESICALGSGNTAMQLEASGRSMVRKRYSVQSSLNAWNKVLQLILAAGTQDTVIERFAIRPSGRLDYLVGVALAEGLRKLFGRTYHHSGPGGEWPHAISVSREDSTNWA